MLVNEPTYFSSSLLDHVYVNNDSPQKYLVNKIETISIYFSDHDAVKFTLIGKSQFAWEDNLCLSKWFVCFMYYIFSDCPDDMHFDVQMICS